MDRMDMIFELLKTLDKKSDSQSESLIRVEKDLNYHIRRTDLLEDALEHRTAEVEKTLKTKMDKVSLKALSAVLAVVGSAIGILVSLGWL